VRLPQLPALALLIDDNAARRTVIAEVLTDHGFQVREASDGARGLPLALHLCVDVVVLALALPGHWATKVLHGLGDAYPARDMPVLIVGKYALLVVSDDVRSLDGRLRNESEFFALLGQIDGVAQRVRT
jgi:CheY-like chemotaxis protein